MGEDVLLVSSAEETAKDVYATLRASSSLRAAKDGERDEAPHEFLTTGDPVQFRRVAYHFLGPVVGGVTPVDVRVVEGVSWS
jgi:glutamate racemase